jgi:hypothetical protein
MEPRNRFRGIDFANLCSLTGRYEKQGCRTGPPGWKSIPGLLKRSSNTGTGRPLRQPYMTYLPAGPLGYVEGGIDSLESISGLLKLLQIRDDEPLLNLTGAQSPAYIEGTVLQRWALPIEFRYSDSYPTK